MEKISLVIPVYNEAGNIQQLIGQVNQAFRGHDFEYETIVVDDGSNDDTVARVKELNDQRVCLIQLKRNYGQCPAIKAGIDYSTGDYIATIDGDLQNDPADLVEMLRILQNEPFDVVTGIRKKRKDQMFLRKIPSLIANSMIRTITGTDIVDNGCAIKLFKRQMVKDIPLYGELHRFIAILAIYEGAKVKQIDVKHYPRTNGVSKYGLSRTFKVLSDLVLLQFYRKYAQKPMYYFGKFGFLLTISGTLILFYLLIIKILGHDIWGKPLIFLGVLLLLAGLQVITSGIILDYIMRTYFESQNKKPYGIKDIYTRKLSLRIPMVGTNDTQKQRLNNSF
ncbi:MAG: glycosyltransferase family 2 protein [Prolixibacteraceae bacterium]|jgi:glycosyltransferase involved in cell wall biosynthesis